MESRRAYLSRPSSQLLLLRLDLLFLVANRHLGVSAMIRHSYVESGAWAVLLGVEVGGKKSL